MNGAFGSSAGILRTGAHGIVDLGANGQMTNHGIVDIGLCQRPAERQPHCQRRIEPRPALAAYWQRIAGRPAAIRAREIDDKLVAEAKQAQSSQ